MKEIVLGLLLGLFLSDAIIEIYHRIKYRNATPMKKNFPFTWKGVQYWFSRSCAVAMFAFCKDKNGDWYILANKRGKGTPDYQGCWNAPCGYLDFNEDSKVGAIREVREETGVGIPYEDVKLVEVNSSPNSNRQNVTLRHIAILDGTIEDYTFNTKDMEEDEVDEVAWIKVNDSEITNRKWAFGHGDIIKHMYEKVINNEINDCSVE